MSVTLAPGKHKGFADLFFTFLMIKSPIMSVDGRVGGGDFTSDDEDDGDRLT